jgi:hypothetical protein
MISTGLNQPVDSQSQIPTSNEEAGVANTAPPRRIGKIERICVVLFAACVYTVLFGIQHEYYFGEAYWFNPALPIILLPAFIASFQPRITRAKFYIVSLLVVLSFRSLTSLFLALVIAVVPVKLAWTGIIHAFKRITTWWKRITYIIFMSVLLGSALVLLGFMALVVFAFGDAMIWKHERPGQRCMTTLSAEDIPVWEERTRHYLETDGANIRVIGVYPHEKPIPEELQKIGIIRIDINENTVSYMWMGGFNHVGLRVQRLEDGSFEFTGQYSDNNIKKLWPKEKAP